jgi:hypothetical protein
VVPYTVDASVAYDVTPNVQVFGNFANFFQGFFLDGRPREDRIYQTMKRLEAGVRYHNENVFHGLGIDLALTGGYAFDQRFDRGFDVRDLHHVADISPEPFVGIMLLGGL